MAGGDLAVGVWHPEAGQTVLAVHGITANHLSWSLVARRLPEVRLAAPDLRGRGDSAHLGGPYGMARHADDLVAVLDALGVDHAVVAGHSMGGLVAVVLARRHPDRVTRLVLADGGLPLHPPPGVSAEDAMNATLGPAARRLSMTFPSYDAYLDYWRAHPAFATTWSPAIADYLRHDLGGAPPELRSRCRLDAVREDAVEILTSEDNAEAWAGWGCPAVVLLAERGLLDQPQPIYAPETVRAAQKRHPALEVRAVPGTNHYTLLLGDVGAATVAEAIRAVL